MNEMAKINELTPEQEADLSATRDKWLDIGLSTAPIDREASKSAVAKMYECARLPAPNVFIFLDSPRQGAIAAALLPGRGDLMDAEGFLAFLRRGKQGKNDAWRLADAASGGR